ncbi:MAG: acyltransferase family protein [Ruminococcus sp.]|nr:acyltransferase family protein [Ruminococcus sp.]
MSQSKIKAKSGKQTQNSNQTKKPNVQSRNSVTMVRKPYYAGIDILKIIAALFVVGVHSFLYNGFYYEPITDRQFIIPIATRWITYTCVPIFMTVSGYLMKNKKLDKKYYLGLLRVIVIYIVVSIICMRFNHEHYGTEFDSWSILRGFLQYSNANYGWYVNYYIALFAFIPFLNMAFNGLENKKQRFALVATVAIFTIFARSLYIGFDRAEQSRLLPDYLNGAWPIAYYYAGAFIREYPPKRCFRNKLLIFAVLAAAVIFITESTYKHSSENVEENYRFLSWHFNDYGTYPVFIIAVCIFLLLFDITIRNKVAEFIIKQLSGATFALYLISYVFDNKYYAEFNAKYPDVYERWKHSYEIVGKNFLYALLCALVIQNLYKLCEFGVKKLAAVISQKRGNSERTA